MPIINNPAINTNKPLTLELLAKVWPANTSRWQTCMWFVLCPCRLLQDCMRCCSWMSARLVCLQSGLGCCEGSNLAYSCQSLG